MRILRYTTSDACLDDVESFLLEDIYMNNLMLGILYRLKGHAPQPGDFFMLASDDSHKLVAIMSGLYLILYANTEDEALYRQTIRYLKDHNIDYPGIIGPVACCDTFKSTYEKYTGEVMKGLMNQRIFMIRRVQTTSNIEATLVPAQSKDIEFLHAWMYDFLTVAKEQPTPEKTKKTLESLIDNQNLYLLNHHGNIVSMAASGRPCLKGISVSCVYTPEALRNQGYATKCVELLTEHLLESYDYCTLYTDLANPTSNSIYQKIGYRPIGDSVVYVKPNHQTD